MDPQYTALAILAAVVIVLATEKVPPGVVGLGGVVALVCFNVIDGETAFASLGSPIAMLIASAFVFGTAFFKVGLADDIGVWIRYMAEKYGKGSEVFVIALVMVMMAGLSTVLPNTGVAAALLPILIVIAKKTGIAAGRVLLPAAFASSLGGMVTLIGSPNNFIGRAAMESAGAGTFGFLDFAWVGIPVTILSIFYLAFVGVKFLPNVPPPSKTRVERSMEIPDDHETPEQAEGATGTKVHVDPRKRNLTIIMFFVFILGITFESMLPVPDYIVGMIAAGVLIVSGVLKETDAFRNIDWSSLFFIVGILTLADAITQTGANKTLADGMVALLGGNPNQYILITALFCITALLTQFMSNTATAGVLAPVAVTIGMDVGANPAALVLAVVYGASCAFATPIGTPANMMMASPGNLKFFDWLKVGWPLFVITLAVCLLVLPVVYPS